MVNFSFSLSTNEKNRKAFPHGNKKILRKYTGLMPTNNDNIGVRAWESTVCAKFVTADTRYYTKISVLIWHKKKFTEIKLKLTLLRN